MANKSEKEPLYSEANQDDQFYEAADGGAAGAVYDNVMNSSSAQNQEEDQQRHEEEQREWKADLAKLEDEITTLRQVLGTKVQQANAIKRKLGITPMHELTTDIKKSVQTLKDSGAYQKTNEKITEINEKITHSQAYQKTSATLKTVGEKTGMALSTVGAFASRKYGDMRNSNAFKSFEEKVGGAVTNVKAKVSGSQSEHSFEEALSSAAEAEREDGAPSPEQKVPL